MLKPDFGLDFVASERLLIIPLNYQQLQLYIKSDPQLEAGLGMCSAARNISTELATALTEIVLPRVAAAANDFRYVTLWSIYLKNERIAVGDLGFKGEPDAKGQIEIGYGMYEAFRQKGYMKEAIAAMLRWAGKQKQVRSVMAETEITNPASLRVLEQNGFRLYKQSGDLRWLSVPTPYNAHMAKEL